MPYILPHSAQIKSDVEQYLKDAAHLACRSMTALNASGDFRNIYKVTLATDAVLKKLSTSERPRLAVARSILRRVPFFISLAQLSAARVELRRLIEVTFWCVYFSDHPVEWDSFAKDAGRGIETERTTPISYSAHREPSYYANYAKERLADEASGIAIQAANNLSVQFGNLSATVHAGTISTGTSLLPPTELLQPSELSALLTIHRAVCASACTVLAAFFRNRFDHLPPMHRAWFDWLLGSETARSIRAQEFGLPARTRWR